MDILGDISNDEAKVVPLKALHTTTKDIPPLNPQGVEPQTFSHALTCISTHQTLKLIGYIKHQKFIVLIDNSSTQLHSSIHNLGNPLLHPRCEQLPNDDR